MMLKKYRLPREKAQSFERRIMFDHANSLCDSPFRLEKAGNLIFFDSIESLLFPLGFKS